MNIPRYPSDFRPLTRYEILEVIESDWIGASIQDVAEYLTTNGLKPVGYNPFEPIPDLPEDMPTQRRMALFTEWEQNRSQSLRYRELFDIAGLPAFVPQHAMPSGNDSDNERAEKTAKIKTLGSNL